MMHRVTLVYKPGATLLILPDQPGNIQNERGNEAGLRIKKTALQVENLDMRPELNPVLLNTVLFPQWPEFASGQLLAIVP